MENKQLRSTKAKRAILELFQNNLTASSHNEIFQQIKDKADRATVYRILNSYTDEGVLHRVVSYDGVIRFALCDSACSNKEESHNHTHLHFSCEVCKKVTCLEDELHFQLPQGYSMKEANFSVSGVCKDCTSTKNNSI
jgi:Fur family ferric uptake transcriptional regulator